MAATQAGRRAAMVVGAAALVLAACGEEEVSRDMATPDEPAPSAIADTAWMGNPPPVTLPSRDTVVGLEPAGSDSMP